MKLMKNKIDKRVFIIMIIGIMIGIIISITSSYVLAQTLVNSKDVYYEDNSGLAVNNVQAAIDGTCTKFSNELTNFLNKIYPVGTIYTSTASTNPSTFLGGTWENYGNGRVLKGINSGTAGSTGGSETVTLKEANLPSHSHSIPALSGSTSADGGHTPSGTISTKELIGKAWDIAFQEKAYLGAFTGIISRGIGSVGSTGYATSTVGNVDDGFTINATHNHTFTGTAVANHTHTVTTTTNTTGSTGSGTAFSTLDPYITVYMWRRTA